MRLESAGIDAVLIGTSFMEAKDTGKKIEKLFDFLKKTDFALLLYGTFGLWDYGTYLVEDPMFMTCSKRCAKALKHALEKEKEMFGGYWLSERIGVKEGLNGLSKVFYR